MDNKNYYELLQVDKNASNEIIDKAYKLLIKKYHPDLQEDSKKEKYEEIIKKINEAYEILSDEEKRKEYNNTLETNLVSRNEYDELYNENQKLKQELNNTYLYIKQMKNTETRNNYQTNNFNNNNINNSNNTNNINEQNLYQEYEQKVNDAINKAYHDAYIEDLKNRGYKIKYKKTFKSYLTSIISIMLTIFIMLLIFQIPFIKNYFIKLYNDNEIIKFIVDFFKK